MSTFELSLNLHNDSPVYHHHDITTPNYNYPNWHDNIEMQYITEGEGTILCGAHNYEATAGDVFVINTNNIHSVTSKTLMKSTSLIIDNNFCITNGIPIENIEFTTKIKSKEVSTLCEKLIIELDNNLEYKTLGVRTALLNLMLYLARNHSTPNTISNNQKNISNESMKIAMGYMKSHFNQDISLDKISYEAGLSKFYFSREFKNITGLTPITYLNILRCYEAKKLLKDNEYTVHEISEKCGFLNDSYFSKTFKKYTGMLPSEFVAK